MNFLHKITVYEFFESWPASPTWALSRSSVCFWSVYGGGYFSASLYGRYPFSASWRTDATCSLIFVSERDQNDKEENEMAEVAPQH